MKQNGPDGPASWTIAVSCCFINTMMYGMNRLSGMLFVASITRYHVGRADASFPYTFANFIRNTIGPLVGYLGHKFGVRLMTTFGCLLAAIGVGACFVAENIGTITVLWGTIFGLGFGLGNILLPVKINQYFDKYRATASGISFSGGCVGSFVMPPIVEILLSTYGLSGTFLILSGLVLNCVPAALLLRKPDFVIKPSCKPQSIDDSSDNERLSITSGRKVKLYTIEDRSNLQAKDTESAMYAQALSYDERIKRLSTQTLLSNYSIRMNSPDPLDYEKILQNSKGRRQVDQADLECEIRSLEHDFTTVFAKDMSIHTEEGDKIKDNSCLSTKLMWDGCDRSLSNNSKIITEDDPTSASWFPSSKTQLEGSGVPLSRNSISCQYSNNFKDVYVNNAYQADTDEKLRYSELRKGSCRPSGSESKSTLDAFRIIYNPIFVLITITNALYCFTFICMVTVIVDFARDIGVETTNEKYVLMSLSVGDLIGRLGLGWVTDEGYMTRTGFASLCFLCQGVMTTVIAWSTGFPMLIVLAALYGLSEAGLILIFPLIVAEFIEEDKQAVAIPSSSFLAGPLCLAVAPLIGYFRDEIGSYDYIFFGIGIISALCSFAWLLTTCIVKYKRKTRKV